MMFIALYKWDSLNSWWFEQLMKTVYHPSIHCHLSLFFLLLLLWFKQLKKTEIQAFGLIVSRERWSINFGCSSNIHCELPFRLSTLSPLSVCFFFFFPIQNQLKWYSIFIPSKIFFLFLQNEGWERINYILESAIWNRGNNFCITKESILAFIMFLLLLFLCRLSKAPLKKNNVFPVNQIQIASESNSPDNPYEDSCWWLNFSGPLNFSF